MTSYQKLRLRSPQGQTNFGADLTPDSSFSEFQNAIERQTGIPVAAQIIKVGFPPKITKVDGSTKLVEVPLRDGDQVLVESGPSLSASTVVQPSLSIVPTAAATPTAATSATASRTTASMSLPSKTGSKTSSDNENYVTCGTAYLHVREMEDDNSCLFRSISYLTTQSANSHAIYRSLAASAILKNPTEYPEVVLGRPPAEYCRWIQEPRSWGGAIELSVFSETFGVEICSIDVGTGRVDRFGQGRFDKMGFVLYSGIHYDALALSPFPTTSLLTDQTQFPVDNTEIFEAAVRLADIWKRKKKFTDLAKFTLKCGVCGVGVVGEKGATKHATLTGHANFCEYS